ncbi:MAG: mechanosensitive ion channel family protein [Planctomycetes bacterium]|nr:mechanosensitive ion channel family protein [Planctomycetota bacterium]
MHKILLALLLFCSLLTASKAQEPESAPPTVKPLPELRSPRATLRTFLSAMRDKETELAVSCLDLGKLTKEATATSGPNVAYKLHVVIKRLTKISLDDKWLWKGLPDENDYEKPYRLDTITGAKPEAADLDIRRNKDDANWRFSQETCERIETLYNKLEQAPEPTTEQTDFAAEEEIEQPFTIRLRNAFPVFLRHKTFLLPDYQWLCLLTLIFIGLAADALTRWLFSQISSRWLDNYIEEEEHAARAKIWRPIGRLMNAATWYWGTKLIGLPPATLNILLAVLKLFTIYAAAWTAFAMIDVAAKYLARQALRTDTKFDDLLVPLVSKSLKILVACVAILTAAQTFDAPILGLVGGLGIGGAALAFASKDAVANFFGSLTVLFDRPFEVGDWIVTAGAEGTVETVGFRSTRVRTFYNSLITLPNSHLTTAAVDNMGQRRYRRIKTTLGVQYDTTPDQLEAFCEGVRELILSHPNTRKDYFHVYFNDFGPSSLDIMLYCFVSCPDWGSELQSRHRLFSDIIRLAGELGVQFAFPTRTLHMVQDET